MSILLITGPANSGKARAVMDVLRAQHARGRRPLLVVPTLADVERYGSELADAALAPAARAIGFDGLLAAVVRRGEPSPVRPLAPLARERLLIALSGRASRGVGRALGDLVSDLRVGRINPGQLSDALGAWVAVDPAASGRARRIAAHYEGYERVLKALDRSDPEQRATAALDALRRTPARWGDTPVLFYGFDDFTALQLDTIETLGTVVGVDVAVALAFERGRMAFAGRARTFQMLRPLADEHRELAAHAEYYAPAARRPLHHLERHLFDPSPAMSVPGAQAVRLLEGGGEREELDLIAEEIAALLARGVPACEIAVAHRAPAAIAELLEEVFASRSIPYTLQRRVRFADTALGGALLGALHVAREPDAEIEHLLRWLRASGEGATADLADELEARARRSGAATIADGRRLWEAARWPAEPLRRLEDLRGAAGGSQELIESVAIELERLGAQVSADGSPRERQALEAAGTMLRELGELAGARHSEPLPVALEDVTAPISVLRGLELVVEAPLSDLGRSLPRDRGGKVAVLDPLGLRARRVRALFLCGLQEGVFPAPARAEALLTEDDRRRIVEASGLLALADKHAGADALAAERYLFYAAVSRPEELLVLSWHVADDEGAPCSRSLFVDDVCDLLSFEPQDARRGAALGEVGGGTIDEEAPAPGIDALRDTQVLEELRGQRMWSASSLETWADCPVRWFVQRLLAARDLQPEPEPLARGTLAHAALRDVLDGLRRETGSARLCPAVLERARELLGAALDRHEHERPLSVAPERVPGVRRRLQADLERYLEHAAERESPLEPQALELAFGFAEEPDSLPPLDLGDDIAIRGRIDRVDVDPVSGVAVVYDYKGSHAPPAARWARERSLQVPLYMQALQDARGVHVAGGFYQPLSGRDLRARGALEEDTGIELDCVRSDTYEAAELRDLLDEALQAARAAASQARSGELEARPATCGFGNGGCMYPEICRCGS